MRYEGLSSSQKYNGKGLTGNAERGEASSRVSESNLLNLTDLSVYLEVVISRIKAVPL